MTGVPSMVETGGLTGESTGAVGSSISFAVCPREGVTVAGVAAEGTAVGVPIIGAGAAVGLCVVDTVGWRVINEAIRLGGSIEGGAAGVVGTVVEDGVGGSPNCTRNPSYA